MGGAADVLKGGRDAGIDLRGSSSTKSSMCLPPSLATGCADTQEINAMPKCQHCLTSLAEAVSVKHCSLTH